MLLFLWLANQSNQTLSCHSTLLPTLWKIASCLPKITSSLLLIETVQSFNLFSRLFHCWKNLLNCYCVLDKLVIVDANDGKYLIHFLCIHAKLLRRPSSYLFAPTGPPSSCKIIDLDLESPTLRLLVSA